MFILSKDIILRNNNMNGYKGCLLYTSDAADE